MGTNPFALKFFPHNCQNKEKLFPMHTHHNKEIIDYNFLHRVEQRWTSHKVPGSQNRIRTVDTILQEWIPSFQPSEPRHQHRIATSPHHHTSSIQPLSTLPIPSFPPHTVNYQPKCSEDVRKPAPSPSFPRITRLAERKLTHASSLPWTTLLTSVRTVAPPQQSKEEIRAMEAEATFTVQQVTAAAVMLYLCPSPFHPSTRENVQAYSSNSPFRHRHGQQDLLSASRTSLTLLST